ncbi:hypothetical protein KA119_00495 [Candidatus Gracilibacteria bacterium]|nr:hypothetical protein [Candidatus Gracilibacteria bacterium]
MQKFTAFTVLLTIVVVVVVGEIVANDYLPKEEEDLSNLELDLPQGIDLTNTLATNVLASGDLGNEIKREEDKELVAEVDGLVDFEESAVSGLVEEELVVAANPYLREEQIRSAGFLTAYIEGEAKPAEMFKSVKISDLRGVEMSLNLIRNESEMLAKVYIFRPSVTTEVGTVYDLLKERAAAGLNAEVNENNEFGEASFYMNDGTRATTAFLVTRIGGVIYGFSYPKAYHAQVKNLIQLIEWELQ